MRGPGPKFVRAAVFVAGTVYFLFIMFTIVFSGRKHSLCPVEGFNFNWISGYKIASGLFAPAILVIATFLIYAISTRLFEKGQE